MTSSYFLTLTRKYHSASVYRAEDPLEHKVDDPGREKVRVLRIFSRLNVGGPSVHVIVLTAGLAERGYETRLLVGYEGEREGDLHELAQKSGVRCIRVAGLGREVRPWSDILVLGRLYREIRAFRPSVVHTHTAKAGFVGRIAARLARVPVIVHTFHGHVLRGYFGPIKTALYRMLERWLARGSDVLIAVSDAVKQDLVTLKVAPAERIRVVPLGLPLESLTGPLPRGSLRQPAGVPEGAPLVGIVGRLVPIKDVGTFLDAAAHIRRARPEVHFAVVGDGELRAELESRTQALGLGQAVHFHGWRSDMAPVYGDLDVVVNCSRNEGTPVALIEALAAGRAVVATRVGGTPDLLGNGARGTLVPPGDSLTLAEAVLGALQQPAPERLEAARAYVLARHSVTRLLADVDGLYRELLGGATPA
jgi:glycosyltransferase involved in cell wall biosynthesis